MNGLFVLWMLFVHWFGDFFCQNDEMAINKSHSWWALFDHCVVYFIVLWFGIMIYNPWPSMPSTITVLIFCLNFPAHFIIDGITSRINAKLYTNHRHWFFTMIGFDQVLHYAVLFWTLGLLG
jgi:hypothetical protein